MIYSRDLKERPGEACNIRGGKKYRDVREKAKLANTRAKQRILTKIVADAKHKYDIIDANISIHIVWTGAKRNKLSPDACQGTPSPMLSIEPYLVVLISQLSRMRLPITVAVGLQLANSLIVGTSFESMLRAWKEKHDVHARRMLNVDNCVTKHSNHLLGWRY